MVSLYSTLITIQNLWSRVCNAIGEEYMTMNVHLLLHLLDTVKRLGPLWGHSCFPFESLNGYLLTLFHGTTHVDKQVKYEILH